MFNRSRALRGLAPVVLVLAAACSDRSPVGPGPVIEPQPNAVAVIKCDVSVANATMTCAQQSSGLTGARALLIGGQGTYVKVTSMGTSYDADNQRLHTNVTVQNLLRETLGTPDGSTLAGVKVFFLSGPVVTSGEGTVEVANEDGTESFTSGAQPYFLYNEMLSPYQISQIKNWQFFATADITFSFQLMVSAPMADESARAGLIWTGEADSLWSNGANWKGGAAPTATSSVSILADSAVKYGGRFPVLGANAQVANLYVSAGSTVDLAAFTLTASGNVDAPGAVSSGTVQMTGAATVLRGNIGALVLTGSTTLQGGTKTTGAVSIQDGAMNVTNFNALTISVP